MNTVLHLVAQDLRAHRGLLLAWVAVVVAHPLVSVLRWEGAEATGVRVQLFIIATRLVLGALAIATFMHPDTPLDDRTFWRTRPVAPRTMALAKLAMGALLVAVPVLVVLVVGLAVRVPVSHLPSTLAQVVITDGAAVGILMLVSARTRGVATMVIALAGTLVAGYVLLIALTEILRGPWLRQFYELGKPRPDLAAPTMLIVAAVTSWTMTALVFLGERYRLRLLALGATGVVALAVIWFVPAARLHQSSPELERRSSLSVDGGAIRAERLETGRIALLARGTLTNLHVGDRSRQYLVAGIIDTDAGRVAARQATDLQYVAGQPGSHPVLLGVLSEADFRRLAGRPVQFDGRIAVEIARTDIAGTLPLLAGASVDVGDMRVRIREVRPSSHPPRGLAPGQGRHGSVPLASVDITWTTRWTQASPVITSQWWLRHGADRKLVWLGNGPPLAGLELLPSLARPFGHDRSEIWDPGGASTALDAASSLDIEQHRRTVERPLRVDFVVPTTVIPYASSGISVGRGRVPPP